MARSIKSLTKEFTLEDEKYRIRKITVGVPNPLVLPGPGKVLMLLGETGAGKSTLIDGLVNYIMGVRYEDDFQYILIDDEDTSLETQSHTKWITAYTFHKELYPTLPYTFTIVDSPGYGDTDGIERDRQITRQIKEFFSLKTPEGIDHFDGIGLVMHNASTRCSHTLKYIFDCILELFGNDFKNNIFVMVTFSDGSNAPPVLKVLEHADVQYRKHFLFNNKLNPNEKPAIKALEEVFWKMRGESFEDFFASLSDTTRVSLALSKEVLDEREKLEFKIEMIQKKIYLSVNKIDELHIDKRALEVHDKELRSNQNFSYRCKTVIKRKVPLKSGTSVTNCKLCKTTCHFPCRVGQDTEKVQCFAMKKDGRCKFCPKACHWKDHQNCTYRFETQTIDGCKTFKDLKKRYDDAAEEKSKVEKVMHGLKNEISQNTDAICSHINEAAATINRLREIALKPNPLSVKDYISLMIQTEMKEAKPGFMERIETYNDVKEKVIICANIHDNEKRQKHLDNLNKSSEESLRKNLLDLKTDEDT